jgi:hypothetical protein
LKEQGYQSDSTLVFKKRSDVVEQLSPVEQKQAYKSFQEGGEVPLHGFRKHAPEKPKGKQHSPSNTHKHSHTDFIQSCTQHSFPVYNNKSQTFFLSQILLSLVVVNFIPFDFRRMNV